MVSSRTYEEVLPQPRKAHCVGGVERARDTRAEARLRSRAQRPDVFRRTMRVLEVEGSATHDDRTRAQRDQRLRARSSAGK